MYELVLIVMLIGHTSQDVETQVIPHFQHRETCEAALGRLTTSETIPGYQNLREQYHPRLTIKGKCVKSQ